MPARPQKRQRDQMQVAFRPGIRQMQPVRIDIMPDKRMHGFDSGVALKPDSLSRPWELYRYGLLLPPKLLADVRTGLKKIMFEQSVEGKQPDTDSRKLLQQLMTTQTIDALKREDGWWQEPVIPAVVPAPKPSDLLRPWELYDRGMKPSLGTILNADTELRRMMVKQILGGKASDNDAWKRLKMINMKQAVEFQQMQMQMQMQQAQRNPKLFPHRQNKPAATKSRRPMIYFGTSAPYPRWVIIPDDPTVKPYTPAWGSLKWEFEPGSVSAAKGMPADKLYEYAYRWLEGAFTDPLFREQLRFTILNGPFASLVKGLSDPLPPIPTPPRIRYYPPGRIVLLPRKGGGYFFYDGYERPSIAAREGMFKRIPDAPAQRVKPEKRPDKKGPADDTDTNVETDDVGRGYGLGRRPQLVTLDNGQGPLPGNAQGRPLNTSNLQRYVIDDLNDPPDGARKGKRPASGDDGEGDQGRGIRQRARIKRTGKFARERRELAAEDAKRSQAPTPEEVPKQAPKRAKYPKERQIVQAARKKIEENLDKYFPPGLVNRRIRTWPGFVVPKEVMESREMKDLLDRPSEHRPFHPRPDNEGDAPPRGVKRARRAKAAKTATTAPPSPPKTGPRRSARLRR